MFISIGTVIIDDIVLPDGTAQMGCLGGGSVHAAMGMRVWSEQVGLVAKIGHDFPQHHLNQLKNKFDLQGLAHSDLSTTRAWQLFETDGTRREIFRTEMADSWQFVVKVEDFPKTYCKLSGVHLHSMGDEIASWVPILRQKGDPFILWEPWDIYCVAENRNNLREVLPLVDGFSPSLGEAQQLLGLEKPQELLDGFLNYGARMVAIRMGAKGSVFANAEGVSIHIPIVPIKDIVDVTGAGNAYCGGLVVGLVQTRDPLKAVCYAAVSASFALEQFGALFALDDIHQRSIQRYESILAVMSKKKNH